MDQGIFEAIQWLHIVVVVAQSIVILQERIQDFS